MVQLSELGLDGIGGLLGTVEGNTAEVHVSFLDEIIDDKEVEAYGKRW